MTRVAKVSDTSSTRPLAATRSPVDGLAEAPNALLRLSGGQHCDHNEKPERALSRAVDEATNLRPMGRIRHDLLHPQVLLGRCDGHQRGQGDQDEQ